MRRAFEKKIIKIKMRFMKTRDLEELQRDANKRLPWKLTEQERKNVTEILEMTRDELKRRESRLGS